MREKIFEFAKKLNIDHIGVAPVCYYEKLDERTKEREKKYGLTVFEEKDEKKRTDPRISFPWARSIIVCLFPYYTGDFNEDSNISVYAQIPDYHGVAKEKLKKISEYIARETNKKCECFSDTGVLNDRFLAYLAGLGFFGLNTCLINDECGSYFFIGYIVSELELAYDKPNSRTCMMCRKCIDVCPAGAIDGEFHIDTKKCVSYITQMKTLTDEQQKILNAQNMVYGCDKCQSVCPHNQNLPLSKISEFYEKKVEFLSEEELIKMSNKEFLKKYGDFAFSWRGKAVILKNFNK